MKILVLGGTRFFGIHMVKDLIAKGHDVTIATRGITSDDFGDAVSRICFERTDEDSIKAAIAGTHYDVIIDKIAYCSNDIRKIMEAADCDKYIYMSSTAVYDPKHINTVEEEFDGTSGELIWCDRKDFPYDVIKRQAEYALWQKYPEKNWIAVRYPFVIGKDDYTKRLYFYVEHVLKHLPMKIDDPDSQMAFIRSDEAGKFLSFLVEKDFEGAINGSSKGTVSIREILGYLEKKTGIKAVISDDGDPAPYNGESEYSINTQKAESLGFGFTDLKDWLCDLLDYYINLAKEDINDSICIKSAETDEELCGRGYVHCTAWQEAYRGIVCDRYLDTMNVEATTARARNFPDNTLVAKDNEKVVGFAVYGPSRDEDLADAGEVEAIYVLSEYYGRKIGYRLMKEVFSRLSEYNTIFLWVFEKNERAINFYHKLGFEFDGSKKEWRLGTPVTIVRMIKHTGK